MTQVVVGRWGKSLAIRIPLDVARASGLRDGESVELEELAGDILVRRDTARAAARRDAKAAAAEIRAMSKENSLGGLSVRELRDEGRPG